MIPPKRLPEFKKGQILKASDMMALRDAIMRQRLTTGQSSGVTLSETPDCTTIRIDSAGQSTGVFYAQIGSIVAAATGTWPDITSVSATADVYQRTDDGLDKVDEGATIWNAMPDPTIANHRLILSLNPDGSYDIIGMSCSVGT